MFINTLNPFCNLLIQLLPIISFNSLIIPGQSLIKTKLSELVDYNVAHQRYPKTLRFISYEQTNKEFESSFLAENQIPLLIGNKKPLEVSPDPRTISTGRMVGFNEVFKYVVLFWIKNVEYLDELVENIKTTVSRRFDRIIILTDKEDLLEEIMAHDIAQNLLIKFGMSLEKEEIWADPLVYQKGHTLKINSIDEFQEKRQMGGNLRGRHFKVAGTEFPPVMYKTEKSDGTYSYYGTQVNIVQVASTKFNYTYEFSYDWSYGEFWPNGTWTGMYAKVFYPEQGYHFTICLSTEYIWNYGVDMASVIDPLDFMFATNQPITKLEWYAFLLPFSPIVWISIIVTYIVLGIVQFFVMYLIHNRKLKYVVWDSAIYLPYAMATEQGLCDIPKGARYLSLIWLLGTLVLGTGYKSTLRKNLSFPVPEIIPHTFDELAKRSDYGVTLFVSGSAETHLLEGSSNQALINIRERMKIVYDLDKCLRDVYQTPHTVCIAWSCLTFYQAAHSLTINSQVEPLVFSKNTPKVNLLSMAFQKDSIYVDSYSRITEGIFETGIIDKWKRDENHKAKQEGIKRLNTEKHTDLYRLLVKQMKSGNSDRYPLKMINLWAIFATMPIGCFLGLILFAMEYYVYNKKIIKKLIGRKLGRPKIFTKLRSFCNGNSGKNQPVITQRKQPKEKVDRVFGNITT